MTTPPEAPPMDRFFSRRQVGQNLIRDALSGASYVPVRGYDDYPVMIKTRRSPTAKAGIVGCGDGLE